MTGYLVFASEAEALKRSADEARARGCSGVTRINA